MFKLKSKKEHITDSENYVPKAFKKTKDKEKNKLKDKRNIFKNTKLKKVALIVLSLFILIIAVYVAISSYKWTNIAKQMLLNENSIIQDKEGNILAKLGSEKKNINISIEQIPTNLKNAYIAIEDERFYSHCGIDIKRTGGAILSYITHFGSSSYGGSTITQQLVKNLTGNSDDKISRKIQEWWYAWLLEISLSKEQILQGYLNIIYVGPNIYGVEARCKILF